MPKNKYTFSVKPEEFKRPKDLSGLSRMYHYLNLTGISRKLPSCKAHSTFASRLDRNTRLDSSTDRKAFAQETGEFFNEIFWELGVWLGHFPNDPNKKYRFLYEDEDERMDDVLERL